MAPEANPSETYPKGGPDPNYGSITVNGNGKGIKCVAQTIEHEKHHIVIYNAFVNANDEQDDSDGIPRNSESSYDGVRTNPQDPNTFKLFNYNEIGDNEVRCRKIEISAPISIYPEKDWANPGCQSAEKFGP